tara:strand:+ start:14 stop:667 length:654 start_codon:yes stop_codon:yes gene_type:complete
MNKLAILGDSFCRPVAGSSHFSQMLGIEVINYSWAGASNHNICQQAVEALKEDADTVFVSFTSSVRISFKLSEDTVIKDNRLYSRYYRPHNNTLEQDLLTSTYYQTQLEYPLSDHKTQLFQNYHKEFTDLAHQVDENYHMICSCLSRLSTSGKKIIWSQGGFEHPSFGTVQEWDFKLWQENKIDLNLWDHIDSPDSRQHIINPQTHRWIADQILKVS